MRIAAAYALLLLTTSCGVAADVDWKAYGFPTFEGPNVCFYDANTVTRMPDGHLRAWTKCLLQKELDGIDTKSVIGKRIVENAARKVAAVYVPPITVIDNLDFNQSVAIIGYEETADLGQLQPKAQFYYELNCSERTIRTLSTFVESESGESSDNKPSEWDYIPPEGAGANLHKILCPQ